MKSQGYILERGWGITWEQHDLLWDSKDDISVGCMNILWHF